MAAMRIFTIKVIYITPEYDYETDGCALPKAICHTARHVDPVLAAHDSEAETAGTFLQSGEPAVVRKVQNGATNWYCSLPLNDTSAIREIFRQAGVHFYEEEGDALMAGSGIAASVHHRF